MDNGLVDMIINQLKLAGASVVDTEVTGDSRGLFGRLFCKKELSEVIGKREILNINYSKTLQKGSIRGMHFQYPPMAEMKLVRCIRGAVYDVIIDIRRDSPTFLEWFGIELSEKNMKMVIIPEGFAHGFQTTEDNSEMLYLHTQFYSKENEGALNYADPVFRINWPEKITDISKKDIEHKFIESDFKGIKI